MVTPIYSAHDLCSLTPTNTTTTTQEHTDPPHLHTHNHTHLHNHLHTHLHSYTHLYTHAKKEVILTQMVGKVASFFSKLHVLVIGPGLGRDPFVLEGVKRMVMEGKKKNVPLVIDADGLWLVAQEPTVCECVCIRV
jgi:NAD(P)H-hydrate repair Nnr-like enzyme with NAD(P)H-hydrate dehydratase domain